MSSDIMWARNKSEINSDISYNECLRTKINKGIFRRGQTLEYSNARNNGVESFSVFQILPKQILASFCDGKIKIPTDNSYVGLPQSMFFIRGKQEKEIADELFKIGKNLECLMPYFNIIQTEVESFKSELGILKTITKNLEIYQERRVPEKDVDMVWQYTLSFL